MDRSRGGVLEGKIVTYYDQIIIGGKLYGLQTNSRLYHGETQQAPISKAYAAGTTDCGGRNGASKKWHTSSNYNLLTEVLRGEWGFKGLVMTDWGTKSVKPYDLHAGNDLIMGGYRSQFLMAALKGEEPEFAADGYVKEETFKVFGGFFKETVECWNAFDVSKEGRDTVKTTVADGVSLNPKVKEKVKEGLAKVYRNKDGSKTVVYRGTNRGAYLDRADVQVCVCRVLEQLMDSVSYREMLK